MTRRSPDANDGPAPARHRRRRLIWGIVLIAYVVALVASHITTSLREDEAEKARIAGRGGPDRIDVVVPKMRRSGPVAGSSMHLSIVHYAPEQRRPGSLPVILLHGSPSGGGSDFRSFGPALASAGYDCYAPDLPGFGLSDWRTPNYSLLANARLTLAAMDQLGIKRAHVLGWSQGGGSAVHMADLAPDRVASLILMASVGAQETEGSGDYYFEHTKYFIGKLLFIALPQIVPHFGLLGPQSFRVGFIYNFADTDQRPLAGIMRRLRTPTLILHGRHDFLVPDWGAEKHHELIGPSELVMLNASHFLPMRSSPAFDQAVANTLAHLNRYDDPAARPLRSDAIYAPQSAHTTRKLVGIEISRELPWWAIVLAIWLATFVSEDLTIITVGLLIGSGSLDWGVGIIGCYTAIVLGDLALWALGRFVGRRVLRWPLIRGMVNEQAIERWGRVLDKHTGKAVLMSRFIPGTRLPTFIAAGILSRRVVGFMLWVALAALLWTPFLLILTMILGPRLLGVFREVFQGPWAIIAAIVVLFVAIRLLSYEATPQGRDRLKADLARAVRREFWPAWLFYLPVIPQLLWLGLRNGGAMSFTCANPGIPNGGGMVGESKQRIIDGLARAGSVVLPSRLIPDGIKPKARAALAESLITGEPELGGYPIILKPNTGYKGYGMGLIRGPEELEPYFQDMPASVQVQKYHPGPHEIGILWARIPDASLPVDEWPGEIFSATHKTFPELTGDGKRPLSRLIWDHPRYRMQAKVFLKRFAGELDRVPAQGERVVLGQAGNHAQGAMFTDGSDRVSPTLAKRLDVIAQDYRDPLTGRRVDFGRFDLRYESPEALARGEGFAIIELNGTASESTNMYDPKGSLLWCYGLLFKHWSRLYRIGAARRREGVRGISLAGLIRAYQQARPHKPVEKESD